MARLAGGTRPFDPEEKDHLRGLLRAYEAFGWKEVTIMRNAALAHAIKRRIRHFSDGMVIGSRDFVEQVFRARREYFGPDRSSGAREPVGAATPLRGFIWAARDLRKEI